ncbi:MAG: CTP synthase, partial [Methanomassiliicoccales archaeon]
AKGPDLAEWRDFANRIINPSKTVKIALVGKYTHLGDSYISHMEAFHHAGAEAGAKVEVIFVDSEVVQQFGPTDDLKKADAILIPGGFGTRGIEGKIMTANYARLNNVPFLGVCLGFQIATIEFARNMLAMTDANSTEFDPKTTHPVVDLLPEQKNVTKMGATMRLGAQPVVVSEGSKAFKIYNSALIMERHRHRYEVNPKYIEDFENAGWHFTGRSADGVKMEIAELDGHPFYVASQFHPEFKSRPSKPSPLHLNLVKAAVKRKYGLAD